MLPSHLPDIEQNLPEIRTLASSGFVIAINVGWGGPELLRSEFPTAWREEYEEKNYFMTDPVFYWTLMKLGWKRWSEIGFPDPMNIAQKAKAHGLEFGVVFSMRVNGRRSFMSAARIEREFKTAEIEKLQNYFESWMTFLRNRPDLSIGELQILRCINDGYGRAEIAAKLGIAQTTVSKRIRSAMSKLGVTSHTEAVSKVLELSYFGVGAE